MTRIKHPIEIRVKNPVFGDRVYNVGYDPDRNVWLGGLATGQEVTFQAAVLPDLLKRIGLDIDARISNESVERITENDRQAEKLRRLVTQYEIGKISAEELVARAQDGEWQR
jgi:hypothetical protein